MEEKSLPLVSVVIPVYNHEKYVAESIQSVINQNYNNIELIIINDGSKDNSHKVIMSYEQKCKSRFKRFEYINRKNKGLSVTLNEMVNWAEGKYFSAIASDDILIANKISLLTEKLENLDENYVVAFGNAIFIDDNSNEVYIDYITGEYTTKEKGGKSFLAYFTRKRDFNYKDESAFGSYKTLLGGNYLPAMSAVIKLDKIKEVNAWTSGNTIEDWEMWLKLSKKYKFTYVDEPVALYRWHDSNTCKTMKYELVRDSFILIENEKQYALSNGYSKEFYLMYISLLNAERMFSFQTFIFKFLPNLLNIQFLYIFLKKIIRALLNDKNSIYMVKK